MDPDRESELDALRGRPKDLIDHVEAIAAAHGNFEPVDENYYGAFIHLSQPEVEMLAVAVMLDHEKEVRRLARGRRDTQSIERVSRLVRNVFRAISLGIARFNAVGRLIFVARIGPDPTVETDEALDRKFQIIEPIIKSIVRRTLPRLLSRDANQGELPLW